MYDETVHPKQSVVERLKRSDANDLVEEDILSEP